jgi:hypothetical protein
MIEKTLKVTKFGKIKQKKDVREILCHISRSGVTPNEIDKLLVNRQLDVSLKTTSAKVKDAPGQQVMQNMEFEMNAAASCGIVELDVHYHLFLAFGVFDPNVQQLTSFVGRRGIIVIKNSVPNKQTQRNA